MSNFREVIHSHRFDAQLEAIAEDPRAADMAAHAMTWALARHPERGFPIPGTSFHIWPVYLRHIEYAVYYKFDDSQVELLAIIPSNQEGVF